MTKICESIEIEIEKIKMDRSVQGRVRKQMEKAQREYYLNEKVKAIQEELGRGDKDELEELKKKIEDASMPKDAKEKAMNEIRRLQHMPPMSAESTVSRTYVEWLVAMPWKKRSREIREISRAEKVLEADHYGLDKVKQRILEYLAVRQLSRKRIQWIDTLFHRPARRGKDLSGPVHRAGDGKEVRPPLAGRSPRRSGDSRAPGEPTSELFPDRSSR